jgi:CheY-specific phosphatase CheX
MPLDSSEAKQSLVDVPAIQEMLLKVIRARSETSLVRSSALKHAALEEVANKDDFLYGHWMALILVSGTGIRIILKIHFDSITGRKMLASKIRRKPEDIDERMAIDHMRETCNLLAGAVKSSLSHAGVITGISIPLVTSGFDEAVFSDKIDNRKLQDVWKISFEGGEVVCSSVSDILNWNEFAQLQLNDPVPESDGDGEFL